MTQAATTEYIDVNHIYLLHIEVNVPSDFTLELSFNGSGAIKTSVKSNTWSSVTSLWASTNSTLTKRLYALISESITTGTVLQFRNAICCDLTQMFGITTTDAVTDEMKHFCESYAELHPEYNSGEIVSADVTGIKSQGKNLLNPQNVGKQAKNEDGTISNTVADTRTNFQPLFLLMKDGKTVAQLAMMGTSALDYTTLGTMAIAKDYSSYDIDEIRFKHNGSTQDINLFNSVYIKEKKFIFSANFVSLDPTKVGGIVIKDLKIFYGTDTTEECEPYFTETKTIPDSVRALDGYGVEGNVVDLHNKTFTQNNYVDGTEIKTLDTPVVTDISSMIDDDFELLKVEGGGTVTFEQASTELPIPSTIVYDLDVEEATA